VGADRQSVSPARFRVAWSDEDREWVGLCDGFPSLSWLDCDKGKALAGIRKLVGDIEAGRA